MSPEDPRRRVERLLRGYSRGWYTRIEVANWNVHVTDRTSAADILCSLTPELLDELRGSVASYPTTDEEWAGIQLVSISGGPDPGVSEADRVAHCRASVEAIRAGLAGMGT